MHTGHPRRRKPTLGEIVSRWGEAHQHSQLQGCVAHWGMVEGGGTTLYDLSGSANHGTLTLMDPATAWTLGAWGSALAFDGVDDYVALGTAPLVATNAPWTVSWLLNVSTPYKQTYPGVLQLQANGSAAFEVFLTADDAYFNYKPLTFGGVSPWGQFRPVTDFSAALVGVWTRTTITYNGADPATIGNFALSRDGVPEALTAANAGVVDGGNISRLGKLGTEPYWLFGALDDVRVYNRVLAPGEVLALTTDPWAPWQARQRVWAVADTLAGIVGDASVTQADQGLSSTGALALAGMLTASQAAQTLSSTGTLPLVGSASLAQANATLGSTGGLAVSGSASLTQAAQTLSSTGAVALSGQAAVTQDPQMLGSTALLLLRGVASLVQDPQTLLSTNVLQQVPVSAARTFTVAAEDRTYVLGAVA